MICKSPQYQGALKEEIDKFSGNPLEYQYFVVEKKVSDQIRSLTKLLKLTGCKVKS